MKVAFVHFYTFRLLRGIETLIVSLSNALVQKGINVSILSAKRTIEPLIIPDPRVNIFTYPTFRYYEHFTIVPFYITHFLKYRYDHVVVFFADFGEGLSWRVINRFREISLSLYLCYPYSSAPHRYQSFLRLRWDQKANYILADANWVAKEAKRLFDRVVHVIPVGTDTNRFRPDIDARKIMRQKYGYDDANVVLLNVSSLEARKGVQKVVQMVARLSNQFPSLRYFILGKGEEEFKLRKMVDELNLNDIVVFGGTTSNLVAYYNMADIFVMLPDFEANSIASHEAMSCSLPLIVSNNGGFLESIPTQAGFLVNPNASAEIDDLLTKLIIQPQLRKKMGEFGRSHVLDHLTWEKIAEKFLRLFL